MSDEPTPATTSAAYDTMAPRWHLIGTLLEGTEAMRAAGEAYLPRHQEESNASYAARLGAATLLNMVEITLDMLAGKPFSTPLVLSEDADPKFTEWAEDIDRQGNNLDVFARRWFRDGLAKGVSYVLADAPRVGETEGVRTLADDRSQNFRPYLVHVAPEDVIFMSATVVNGTEVLTHVRILETELVRDGWAEREVRRVRVLNPDGGELYEWVEAKGNAKGEWRKVEEWSSDLGYIPLFAFYAQREGLGLAKPPLLDLAYMNVRHWQLDSDLNNTISVACFPMLAMSGVDAGSNNESVMRLGPNQILATRSESGKFYYVEHSGSAIESGEKKLKHIEELMASYGAQFLRSKPGDLKATVRALDSAEALSQLQAMTLTFKDVLETALAAMADLGAVEAPTVELEADFGLNAPEDAGFAAIEKARERREISRSTYIGELKRRGGLSEDYDADADLEVIAAEDAELLASTLDLDPAGGEDDDDDGQPDAL